MMNQHGCLFPLLEQIGLQGEKKSEGPCHIVVYPVRSLISGLCRHESNASKATHSFTSVRLPSFNILNVREIWPKLC